MSENWFDNVLSVRLKSYDIFSVIVLNEHHSLNEYDKDCTENMNV